MLRHLPWRKRSTVNTQRVKWPRTIASQMSPAISGRDIWMMVHMPIGTATCDASVMKSGLRVSPVPCKPPV